MNKPLRPHALFIFTIFATLAHAGAPAARASDACSPADFKVARSFDAAASGGFAPASYVAADFNGDGRPDLAATDFTTDTVGVLLNDGAGWLGATTRFSVQDGPEFVAVGDFNGDGRPDLAVTNSGSNSVSVLLGAGGGHFGAATNFSIGGDAAGLAVGDFNGDGLADLAVTNATRRNVSVLLGDGAGSFAPAAGSAPGSTQSPTALAVADFNSDARRDLVVATTSSGVFVMMGDGAGGFSAPTQVFQQTTDGVAAADLNGDGKADLTFGEGGGLVVRLGDGAGGFSAPAVFPGATGGGFINRVAVADFDGDGDPDVVGASTQLLDGVALFKGDGAGGFSLTKSYLTRHPPASLAVADFDGDGDQDVAAGSALLFNAGGGEFEAILTAFQLGEADPMNMPRLTDFTPGDFDGDGRPDVAVLVGGTVFAAPHVVVSLAGASGAFTSRPPRVLPGGIEYRRVNAADFNRDGKLDVAVVGAATSQINPMHVVLVSLGNGDGTLAAPSQLNVGSFGQHPFDLAAGDFNGDANPDLVVTFISSQNFLIMLGDGAGAFTLRSGGVTAPNFGRVAVGDFNGDAKQDLVFTDAASQRVLALSGDGAGGFGPVNFFAVSGRPAAVVVDDFNGDGRSDVAVSTFALNPAGNQAVEDGSVSVLLADDAGGFAPAIHYRAVVFPEDIVAADFDADGKTDLAVSSRLNSTAHVFSGDGAGGFSLPTRFDLAGGQPPSILTSLPIILAAADFDGDNRNDLAAMLPASFAVGVLSGKPPAAQPCLFADDVTVVEGDTGSVNAQVPVRLTGPSAQVVKVNYRIRGFPAAEGQDFTGGAGSLVFQPGETSKFVSVLILGDNIDEPDESVALQFSNPAGARFGDDFAQISITDNDGPPAISISDVTVTEGEITNTVAVFNVTLSAPSTQTISVNFATANGTATAGNDYGANTDTVFFHPGVIAQTIRVNIGDDETHELAEHFFVNLSNPLNSTIADAQGRGDILDDDPVPAVTIFNAFGSEFEGRAGVGAILSNPSALPVTVDFATADGTAAAGSDYNATTGTLTFNPGVNQLSFNVGVIDDDADEVTETFFVNLSNPSNATIAAGQSLVRVIDNDGPTVSVNDASVGEGQGGLTNAVFTLSLSAPSVEDIFVRLRTANGTASATGFARDYFAHDTTVRITAGLTSANVTVGVIGDLTPEPDETFFVNLSNPQGATIADAQGVGAIVNDDATVRFGATSVSASEADGSVRLTVTRTGPLTHPSTLNYATNDGTASDRSDYNAAVGVLEFAPGEASKTVNVFLTNDVYVENAETFSVTLSNPDFVGGPVTSPETAVVTVNSDDVSPAPNPAGDTTFFVNQHYRDFLGRDPDAPGLAHWTNEIESCGADLQCREVKRVHVSAAFFLSIEFQETGFLAYRTYKTAFGDATSPGVPGTVPVVRLREFLSDSRRIGEGVVVGPGDWQSRLDANKQAYMVDFIRRQRFLDAFPRSMSAAEFVDKLNQNAGGVLSQAERDALVAELAAAPDQTLGRANALRRVSEDEDLKAAEKNRAFVLMQFYGYLRRNPDDPQDADFRGWKFWLDKLNEFDGDFLAAEMVKAFITSDEYRRRFGQ